MFKRKVLELFRKAFGPWVSPAPPRRRKPRPTVRPMLEVLEDRFLLNANPPAVVQLYWDPTSGANASTTANWDVGALNSGMHPTNAPGNTANETDNIFFSGSTVGGKQIGDQICTWNYKPANALGTLAFLNGWNQKLAFTDKVGIAVNTAAGVDGTSSPTLAPSGQSGANAVPAITLENGTDFIVSTGGTLNLTGWGTGNAIFFAGDGKAGDYIADAGTVIYTGVALQAGSNVDYIKVPVHVQGNGIFSVNGGSASLTGATLQVSGTSRRHRQHQPQRDFRRLVFHD